jgi:hypothetical protein
MKCALWGIAGGVAATGVVLFAAGQHVLSHHLHRNVMQPMMLDLKSSGDQPASMRVTAALMIDRARDKAKLIIHPFKVGAPKSFASASAVVPLPVTAVPLMSSAVTVPIKVWHANGQNEIDGTLMFGPDGGVTITAPATTGAVKAAWGLARAAVIEYGIPPL